MRASARRCLHLPPGDALGSGTSQVLDSSGCAGAFEPLRRASQLGDWIAFEAEPTPGGEYERLRVMMRSSFARGSPARTGRAAAHFSPSALRPGFGLGYSYEFDFGLRLATAWSGWLFERPEVNASKWSGRALRSHSLHRPRARRTAGIMRRLTLARCPSVISSSPT